MITELMRCPARRAYFAIDMAICAVILGTLPFFVNPKP